MSDYLPTDPAAAFRFLFYIFAIIVFVGITLRYAMRVRTRQPEPPQTNKLKSANGVTSNQPEPAAKSSPPIVAAPEPLTEDQRIAQLKKNIQKRDSIIPTHQPNHATVQAIAQANRDEPRVTKPDAGIEIPSDASNSTPAEEEYLEDDKLMQEDTEAKPVEFLVWSPQEVPPNHRFDITVELDRLPRLPDRLDNPDQTPPETLITQIERFARVGLVLQSGIPKEGSRKQSLPLQVSTPYQALIWDRTNLRCKFVVTSPPSKQRFEINNAISVMINGSVYGRIEFAVTIDPLRDQTSQDEKTLPKSISSKTLTEQEKFSRSYAKTRAYLIKEAFISYEHRNWRHIARSCQPLEVAGITCLIDNLELPPTNDWKAEVDRQLKRVQMVLLFWSETFAGNKSTKQELELLSAEIKRRRDIDHSPLVIDVLSVDGSVSGLPNWLRQNLHAGARFESFEAFHRAAEDEKQFRSTYRSIRDIAAEREAQA